MPEIKKKLELSKIDYYKHHLSFVNCILPEKMQPKEIEILASFMSLEGDVSTYRFGPTAKKLIMEQLELSPGGLSNYIGPKGSLTEKGFLTRSGDSIIILPILFPEPNQQEYRFKLVNNGNG